MPRARETSAHIANIVVLAFAAIALPAYAQSSARDFHSWKELRQHNVVLQQQDYSCGTASLATLIHYYFGGDITEAELLQRIIAKKTPDELADLIKNGVSMLDLKTVAESLGYDAAGISLTPGDLPKLEGPVIVHLKRIQGQHFLVLRGVQGDRVFLADPAEGNVRMTLAKFADQWTGAVLILGKDNFGTPAVHALSVSESATRRPAAQSARAALVR